MYFEIPGTPKGKARARTVQKPSGKVMTYTPEDTVMYENLIKHCFNTAKNKQVFFFSEPLKVEITAYFGIPKSASKKKAEQMAQAIILPTKKPDADNIAKIVCDALNKVAWGDDSQIVNMTVKKLYTAGAPKVCVNITDYTKTLM